MKRLLTWLMFMALMACCYSTVHAAFVPLINNDGFFVPGFDFSQEAIATDLEFEFDLEGFKADLVANQEYKDPGWLSSAEGIINHTNKDTCVSCHYMKVEMKNKNPEPNQRLPGKDKLQTT